MFAEIIDAEGILEHQPYARQQRLAEKFRCAVSSSDFNGTLRRFCEEKFAEAAFKHIDSGEYRQYISTFINMIAKHMSNNEEGAETFKDSVYRRMHDLVEMKLRNLRKKRFNKKKKAADDLYQQKDVQEIKDNFERFTRLFGDRSQRRHVREDQEPPWKKQKKEKKQDDG